MSDVIADALCRHRHTIEWENGRTTVCHDCIVLGKKIALTATMPLMHGDKFRTCPSCGINLGATGLPEIAYTFVVCTCRVDITYDHLVEQLWHITCLQKAQVAA